MKKTERLITIVCFLIIVSCSHKNKHNEDINEIKWERVGPGGGGAMFWPAVSPHDPDFAMVACDMTGSYVTYNGGQQWKMFNLRGPVKFFVFDPVDDKVVYANSIALFRSTDQGNTWKIVYPSESDISGIISKGDHADEIVVTADSTRRRVLALAVDPGNSKKLNAVISINGNTGYFKSDDQGDHWTKVRDLGKEVINIFIDPSSPAEDRTLYFACRNSVIIRDKGNWLTADTIPGVKRINEYSAGYDSKMNKMIIYAISGKSYFNPAGDPSGIYLSDDGGKSWSNRQEGIFQMSKQGSPAPEWRTIATSCHHPSTVYVSYSGLNVSDDTICLGVAKSEDYGNSWKLCWRDVHTKNGDIFSPNYKKGWIDERFGPGWGENPFSIGVSPDFPDICYATDFGRTVKTADGGRTWEQVYTDKKEGYGWISRGLDVTTGYNIVADPFDRAHLFAANTDIGLLESIDGGESWNSATKENGIPRKWMNSTYWLSPDPEVRGRWWAAMSDIHDLPRPKMWRRTGVSDYEGGIVYSDDNGRTWKPVSDDIGEAAVTHLLIDPESNRESRTVYACAFGKGVYKSTDGGKSWMKKNKGIEGTEPFAWRIFRKNKGGELFLIVCRRSEDGNIGNEFDGAVYRSGDGAELWEKMNLPEGTNGPMCIVADEDNQSRIILSAWGRVSPGRFTPDTGGGIFLSENDGKTWKQTLSKDQHIHDITFDERNDAFYACGFNGSAYRSDDRGETWLRLKGYDFKWGKRVEPDPENPKKVYIITFGGGIWHGPARGDEKATEATSGRLFQK